MQPRKYLEAVLMLAAALGVVLITVGTQAASAKVPQFKDYAVRTVHSGQVAQPDLGSHPDARTYRTRLRNAARGAVNFAGKYVLVQWGCGTTCVYGALLNAESGKVIFLPFSVCCWTDVDDSFQPIEVRPNSRLIVFAGLRGEKGPMGAHFYEFRGDEFVFLNTVETAPDFRGGRSKESGSETLIINTPSGPVEINNVLINPDYAIPGQDWVGVRTRERYQITYVFIDNRYFAITILDPEAYAFLYDNEPEEEELTEDRINELLDERLDIRLEAARKARVEAEREILIVLGISPEDACKLDVKLGVSKDVSRDIATENFGLSFCPNGIPF